MEISKIKEKLGLAGVRLLRISGWEQKNFPLINFDEDVESLIALIKDLEVKIVYFQEGIFSEELFDVDSDFMSSDSYGEDINLKEHSVLKKYVKYFGEIPHYHFLVPMNNYFISYYLMEEWFKDFYEAVKSIKASAKKSFFEVNEKQNENNEKLAKELDNIIKNKLNDSAFTSCKTKKVMLEYALEKFTELSGYDEALIEESISNNYSKIKARKLLNKNYLR